MKRQSWNKRFQSTQSAHVASTNEALDQSIQFTVEELVYVDDIVITRTDSKVFSLEPISD